MDSLSDRSRNTAYLKWALKVYSKFGFLVGKSEKGVEREWWNTVNQDKDPLVTMEDLFLGTAIEGLIPFKGASSESLLSVFHDKWKETTIWRKVTELIAKRKKVMVVFKIVNSGTWILTDKVYRSAPGTARICISSDAGSGVPDLYIQPITPFENELKEHLNG